MKIKMTFLAGGLATVLGGVPGYAADPPSAQSIFSAAARPGFVRVDRPSEAAIFGRHLTACGLTPDSESPAMQRGDWPASKVPQRIYALASHALG